jgi:hypothetical protein
MVYRNVLWRAAAVSDAESVPFKKQYAMGEHIIRTTAKQIYVY